MSRDIDELQTRVLALLQQVQFANHDKSCLYWTWNWNFSWHRTDCTCTERKALIAIKNATSKGEMRRIAIQGLAE